VSSKQGLRNHRMRALGYAPGAKPSVTPLERSVIRRLRSLLRHHGGAEPPAWVRAWLGQTGDPARIAHAVRALPTELGDAVITELRTLGDREIDTAIAAVIADREANR